MLTLTQVRVHSHSNC